MVNRWNDGRVAISDDTEWNEPGGDKEYENKDARSYIIRQVVETAAREVAFRNEFAKTKEWHRSEHGRVDPDENNSDVSPEASRLFS